MKITLSPLLGEKPGVDPSRLQKNFAQRARNCSVKRGVLEPALGAETTAVPMPITTKSIFWYNRDGNAGNGFWFSFDSNNVTVVPSPIIDDIHGRVFIAGENLTPCYTAADVATSGGNYPSVTYTLGVPSPEGTIAVLAPEGDPPDGGIKVAASYIETFVTKYGEEGAPGYATADIDRWDGGGDPILTLTPVPSGNIVIQTRKLYRRELNGVYQFVNEIPAAQTTYVDLAQSDQLGDPVETETWLPPNENMKAILSLPNGGIMGWWDNQIAFCVPYQPWAWPIEYRHTLDADVVGAAVTDVGIVVVTKSKPYVFTGSDPNSYREQKFDANQPGVSPRAVVDMGPYVMFASKEGIVGPGGVLSRNDITEEQWQALKPETMHAYRWRDRFLAFYDNGLEHGSFTYHPDEGFIFYTEYAAGGWADVETGDIYLIGSPLKKWGTGNPLEYEWESAEFSNQLLAVPGCARIEAKNYPVTFSYRADGQIVKTIDVQNRRAFRLPNRSHIDTWSVGVEGFNQVNAIHIASTMSEL